MNIIVKWLQKLLFRKKHEIVKLRWEKAELEKRLRNLKQQQK